MTGTIDLYDKQGANRKPLKPTSNYGWTGSAWVPQLVGADGSVALGAGTAAIGKVDHTTSGLVNGKKVVAVTGTAVVLGSASAKWVTVFAYRANSADVYVGGSTVDNSAVRDTGVGLPLAAGEKFTFPVDNIGDLYVNGTAGDGVRFVYGT